MGQYAGGCVSEAGASWMTNWNPATGKYRTRMIDRTDGSQLSGNLIGLLCALGITCRINTQQFAVWHAQQLYKDLTFKPNNVLYKKTMYAY